MIYYLGCYIKQRIIFRSNIIYSPSKSMPLSILSTINRSAVARQFYKKAPSGGGAVVATASISVNTTQGATTSTNGSYTVFKYNASGTFTVTTSGIVSVLIVGGGGGGGSNYGGGGGAGGLVYYDMVTNSMNLTSGNYPVTVGLGGTYGSGPNVRGQNGFDSTFNSIIAKGGGGAAYNNGGGASVLGSIGGCGGGSTSTSNAPTPYAVSNQPSYPDAYYVGGFRGGSYTSGNISGGGGGAGGVGNNGTSTSGGPGGIGYQCNITGTSTYYAGGGSGGSFNVGQNSPAYGGLGGGGNGEYYSGGSVVAGTNGSPNTSGGGGSGYIGGSGIVIILCKGV
jgi:hypothetical protein